MKLFARVAFVTALLMIGVGGYLVFFGADTSPLETDVGQKLSETEPTTINSSIERNEVVKNRTEGDSQAGTEENKSAVAAQIANQPEQIYGVPDPPNANPLTESSANRELEGKVAEGQVAIATFEIEKVLKNDKGNAFALAVSPDA